MKFKTKHPFGISTTRSNYLGIHPNLDKIGANVPRNPDLGPGCYDPKPFECAYKKYNLNGSPWDRKNELEEFSQNLGFRNARILKYRAFIKSQCGPGHYEISDYLYTQTSNSVYKNVGFGKVPRFRSRYKENNPPPGTYNRNIMKSERTQITPVPIFEWDGFIDRFKGQEPTFQLAPNRYDPPINGSIAQTLKKVVSKRGPYDLFTGPRDETTIKNHFGPKSFKGPVNWFNTWPQDLEILLKHPMKSRYGKFLRADRFPKKPTVRSMLNDISLCYKDPDAPGPGWYNIEPEVDYWFPDIPQNPAPFNKSVKEVRPGIQWKIMPGVGRYDPKLTQCKKKKRESWVFKSKVGRNVFNTITYNSF